MNALRHRRASVAVVAAVLLPLSLTACSQDSSDKASDRSSMAESAPADSAPADGDNASADKPFGSACASVPKDGAGSFGGMAKDPVATAASNNPALSTLVTAVKKAGLVDTLNNAQNITVFAPTNDAFAKIPEADLNKVLNDKEMLTKILTYHVVGEKVTPTQLESGTFDTLEKSPLTTAGSGESFKVNDSASVVCGNVPTANATVYIIDSVLMPK
ncbi:Cell surface lipoprotein MPB83 precursor [Streptomyces sp. ADI96-02]|uniref:fasciclin domain-containing protein n=1 Tax=unclassified Streptomyces TaxID=2593676 RepID=UPI000F54D8F2|nr:fasciclin domain-containing protein [Streptomyces sp. ADI96-02]RPK55768.1 Cell surface lipoprotein MPB83 precursor [Streptomyces sp. ADI96-02]